MQNVAVVGSRVGINPFKVLAYLDEHYLDKDIKIVSGGARGVDTIAENWALKNSKPHILFYPDYKTFGKNAPLIRNNKIVEKADIVIAFWDGKSHGTKYTINRARETNTEVRVI